MDRTLTPVSIDAARATIARGWLESDPAPERAGTITLRAHQRDAVRRLRAMIARFGGALLADDVGLGKTYVAVALIAEAPRALVVCPASLRAMWQRSLAAAGARAELITYSALSRGRLPRSSPTLVVLDEAHHARTPGTRRYAALVALATGARLLLLTATPVHNSRNDLAAILALFLGARAWAMRDAELAECVLRREHLDLPAGALPAASAPTWLTVTDDGSLLRAIVELPPPLPPAGGGDGGALVAWGLVRQWASSRGALEGAIRRRLARAAALDAALSDGRYPTARELSAWVTVDDAVQLAFPALIAGAHEGTAPLLDALHRHREALRALLRLATAERRVDASRAAQLLALRAVHAGERIVAFSQYADTVSTLFRLTAPHGGVASLTARGARVAGGRLARAEALATFAPRAAHARVPRASERIDLLLTTDLLSEGLDLGDASVVVHLDLPWTPARLEQRVGRSRRLGAPHARTAVYAFAPPAGAEALLEVERRLREKMSAAGRVTGVAGTILPSLLGPEALEPSGARLRELAHRAIASWDAPGIASVAPVIAAGVSDRRVLLALARCGATPVLAAAVDDGDLSDDSRGVLAAVELVARAAGAPLSPGDHERAITAARRWLVRRQAAGATGGADVFRAPARRGALRRIAHITARAAHHRRALIAPLAARARRVVTASFGLGAEQILETIADAPLADEAWLRALTEFGAIHAAPAPAAQGDTLVALIVLLPR